ncbi:MAG: hypothetical protein K0R39_3646 [Symbiobacteriaceae bacterium]|nr:hypothetical protein [Symbiobacteriaceae bacterium]
MSGLRTVSPLDAGAVSAPLSLLLHPGLTATAKVLWLTLRLEGVPVSCGMLGAITGFTHVTVSKGLRQLAAAGLYSPTVGAAVSCSPGSAEVPIPAGLLDDQRVRPHAKLIYGLIQTLPGFSCPSGSFTCTVLSRLAGLSAVAVRQVTANLAAAGWLEVSQSHRKAPLHFTLRNPDTMRREQEVADAGKRLSDVQYKNEQIMKEYLSLLIDSDSYADNARLGVLPNPESKHILELDRYYFPSVGFEYNGVQHYRTTERFPSEQGLAERQFRAAVKRVLCEQRRIMLVVVHRQDLSLKGMQAKVGNLLPLRNLRGHEELIAYLERLEK